MDFYKNIYLGFYCMVKKVMPNEENADAYALGFMAGAACFLYFAITIFFIQRTAALLETAGVFFVAYGVHHFMFYRKGIEKGAECSTQLIYRSLLYFFIMLSLLMYATTFLV